ncbi:MAG: STAS-like domain-containing protein [Acidovorax sp.]|nr:STAS-like domain-containing protein [Acidovorax sp.]
MNIRIISVANDFSPSPAGRFVDDGPYPGALFREEFLLPAMKGEQLVHVDLTGTELPGSSFLEEAFGGLVRAGFSEEFLRKHLVVRSSRESDSIRVWRFIQEAATRGTRMH